MNESILRKIDWLILPVIGVAVCVLIWSLIAGKEVRQDTVDEFGDKVTKVQRVGLSADLRRRLKPGTRASPIFFNRLQSEASWIRGY
jgi:nitrate/nitrite transport system permease protein